MDRIFPEFYNGKPFFIPAGLSYILWKSGRVNENLIVAAWLSWIKGELKLLKEISIQNKKFAPVAQR